MTNKPSFAAQSSPLSILAIFTGLGLTSFGGPVAHLGYFRQEFVTRRRWFEESAYADLIAVCQILPGPASSQVGFAIGLSRGGLLGGLAAFVGFTLPSAVLLVLFAYGLGHLTGPLFQGALHGLKIVAVAIVAQAVWGMWRALCPDWPRKILAVLAMMIAIVMSGLAGQLTAIAIGLVAGLAMMSRIEPAAMLPPRTGLATPISQRAGTALLMIAAALLLVLPLASAAGIGGHGMALFDAFYRAGALVFGGGHVVLPLLQDSVVGSGWVSQDAFLSGYGAAQAVPGPLFTFAAYLGAAGSEAPNGWAGALIAVVGIFLPGLLLIAGALPHWEKVRRRRRFRAAMAGVNAAVVGLLAAALYDPVWLSAIKAPTDLGLALAAFALLVMARTPPWIVVVLTAASGALLAAF